MRLGFRRSFDAEREMEMRRTCAHGVFVVDDTLSGSGASLENQRRVFDAFCRLSTGVTTRQTTVLALSKTQDVMGALGRVLKHIAQQTRTQRVVLYLCLNGHSYLYRGEEALEHARRIGETPFLARDGSTVRFSTFRYRDEDLIKPSDMKRILDAIAAAKIARAIVFLDTCHSMSLVSALLCPAADIRIIHSTGEDEKTWQETTRGSIMSRAWADAAAAQLKHVERVRASCPAQATRIARRSLWEIIQRVADSISSQVLTTGPGQALSVFN